jgi:hypothetical protein
MSYSTKMTSFGATDIYIIPLTGGYSNDATIGAMAAAVNSNEGETGLYNPDTKALITAALNPGDKFRIYQKMKGQLWPSAVFVHRPTDQNYATCWNYVAPVRQISTVTITAGATQKGQTFGIKVFDNTEASQPFSVEYYTFTSITGAETAAQIAAGIVANYDLRNSLYNWRGWDKGTIYNITVTGAVITITPKDIRTHFEAFTTDEAIGTIATPTPWVAGTMTAQDLMQVEFEGQNFSGYTNLITVNRFENWGRPTNFAKTGCSYDLVFVNPYYEKLGGNNRPHQTETLLRRVLFAIETTTPGTSGSANYTAVKTIFGL